VSSAAVISEVGSDPTADAGWDRRRTLLVLAVLTALACCLHLWSTTRVGRPTVAFDEMGYLGNARWLVGTGGRWEMPTSPTYAIGYSVLLAPAMWLFDTAAAQWRAVMAVNLVLLTSMVPLGYLVARRVLAAGRARSLAAAAVAGSVPAVVAAAPSAIAENLSLPLLLVAVLAAHRSLRPGPWWARSGFGVAAAALYAVHPRFVLVMAVAVVVLLVAWRRQLVGAAVVVANAVGLGVVVAVTWSLSRAVQSDRWDHVEELSGGPTEVWRLISSWDGVEDLLLAAVGQAWYLLAGSLTLVALGVVAWVRVARSGDGDAAPEDTAPEGSVAKDSVPDDAAQADALQEETASGRGAQRMAAVFVLASALVVAAASVQFFARTQFRADHLVYGRHNDTFMPLWMLGATVLVLGARWRLVRLGLSVGAALTAGSFLLLALLRDPAAHDGTYSPFAVPAIARFVRDDPAGTWWRATLAALVGALVIAAFVRLGRRWLVCVVLVPWFVVLGLATVEGTDGYETILYEHFEVDDLVPRLGVDAISIDGSAVEIAFPVLSYASQLPSVDVTTYDPRRGDDPGGPFVLTRFDDPTMRASGARIALIDNSGITRFRGAPEGVAVWVRPGPEQDRLEREGLLLPADFPAALPEAARRVELRLEEPGQVVQLRPGELARVPVRGRHVGVGSPWPDGANLDGPSRVRVAARADGPGGAPTPVIGSELPGWILPGDRFETEVGVLAVGEDGRPLPPGRYEIELGVAQDDPGWFAPGGDGARFTLEVRN
jgi:hypothetical protein